MIEMADAAFWGGGYGGKVLGDADFSKVTGYYDYEVWVGEVVSARIPDWWGSDGQQAVKSCIRTRHGGKWNVVFCDGHVQAHKTSELFDWKSDAALSLRNKDNLPHRDMQADPP